MTSPVDSAASRRRFLQYLAASPLFAGSALAEEGEIKMPPRILDPFPWAPAPYERLISAPNQAVDIFDFEPVAARKVPIAHWAYIATGADGESTLRLNRSDFDKYGLRSRRLVDVSKPDISVNLFGMKWDSPIFICPTGFNKGFHADGEVAVSRGASKGNHMQFLSSAASTTMEDAVKARAETGKMPLFFQLYVPNELDAAKLMFQRAEATGIPVVAITIDNMARRKNVTQERLRRLDKRNCLECHSTPRGGSLEAQMPNFRHIDPAKLKNTSTSASLLTWDYMRRLRDSTKMKFVIKGILDPEDAALCAKYGFDGLIVSNHGGRNDDSAVSTISCLQDCVAAVKGKIPVMIDSGFRRGMDVVKAMAMGAAAVGVGRPYLWGLGAFGQEGVESVLEILRTETAVSMAQAGAPTLKDLKPGMIRRNT